MLATGARVRNTYATYLYLGDSPGKLGLIPHNIVIRHLITIKIQMDIDGHAFD
jgi:hypothetical protein